MNIDYKILWFEDEKEWYNSIIPVIENFLVENGFNFMPTLQSGSENLETILDKNEFDLILVDLNLSGELGDQLIEKLRRFDLYTDIIFYSQSGEDKVRDVLKERSVDGVYCSGRKREDFEEKVTSVINSNIKKVLDLTNLRGLVMAATSELDVTMEEIIKRIFGKPFGSISDADKLAIKEKCLDSLNDSLNKITRLDEKKDFLELLKKLDHRGRWRAVKRLCKKDDSMKDLISTLEMYDEEVITKRNDLAHSCEELNENGKKIIRGRKTSYQKEDFTQIQKDIIKHSKNLENIKKLVS